MIQAKSGARQRSGLARDASFVLTWALFPLWLVGQVARDNFWLTGLCFYIPSAFLAPVFLVFSLVYAIRKRSRKSLLALAIALPPLFFVGFVENRFFRSDPLAQPGALRLVHWNIQGASRGSVVWDDLLARQADVYVLSEVGDRASFQAFCDALGPGYRAMSFGDLAVVGRGSLRSDGRLLDHHRERVRSVVWECAGHTTNLFVVDLPSNVFLPRGPMLERILALIERDHPDLVVGDFNAPRRSRLLSQLPSGYGHAYDTCGSGLGYSWPVPFPMYSLDQCIHGSRVTPVRYNLGWSVHSDHRCQVFDFSIPLDGTAQIQRTVPLAPDRAPTQ